MNNSTNTSSQILSSIWTHLLILYFVAFFIYSNTFGVPFLFDDEGSIQMNSVVHGLSKYFSNWNGYNFLPNRALGYLTFAINYQFHGLNVAGFHIVNLVIHIINSFLVYSLAQQTLCTPFLKESAISRQKGLFAFTVAILFVCHPIQTQAVTYIVQRLTSLATLFFLAALCLHLKWRQAREEGAPFLSRNLLPYYILSILSAILAMKTKEIAFTLPIVIMLFEVTFYGMPTRRLAALLIPMLLTSLVIPLTMLRINKGTGDILSDVNNVTLLESPLSRGVYLCTQFRVVVTYLRLLIFPVNQNLDYNYPVSQSLLEPQTLISFLFLLLIMGSAIFLMYRSIRIRPETLLGPRKSLTDANCISPYSSRLVAVGILWFFITMSVESSFIPITDVIFEHRAYLPSIGFLFTLVTLAFLAVDILKERIPHVERIAVFILVVIAISFSVATYARNHAWRNWLTIWQDTVRKSPDKARPHNILGIGYLYAKNYNAAIPEFETAVRLNPNYMEAWFNLGLVFKNMERYKDSIPMYQKSLALSKANDKLYAKIYCEIGVDYAMLGELDQAIDAFKSAVKYDPEFVEYRKNYAHILERKGLVNAAIQEVKAVLALKPDDQNALEMLKALESRK